MIREGGLFAFSKALAERRLELPKTDTAARPMTMAEKILARHQIGGTGYVRPGDAVVVNVDRKTRNIQLSVRAKDAADQQEAMAGLSQNSGSAGTTSLGALLRAKLDNKGDGNS